MELLNDFNGSDLVSQVLRGVRVRSTVYCRSSLGAPWGFGVRAHGNPAFHVVTEGSCWLEVDGAGGQTALAAGDLAVLPAGPRHWMRDEPATAAAELDEILAASPRSGREKLLWHGGPGPRTGLLCGGFELDGGAHPVLRSLPPVILIRGADGRPVPWLDALLALLNAESAASAPGAGEVVARLADAMLTQALRTALTGHSGGQDRVVALHDPQIGAAIDLIHRAPGHPWTVAELAASVALSRSAFSARFARMACEPPIRYVTRTRLVHAAGLLRRNDTPIAEIAQRIGYGSEFSFAKAFKRMFGVAPGTYRNGPAGPAPALRSSPPRPGAVSGPGGRGQGPWGRAGRADAAGPP